MEKAISIEYISYVYGTGRKKIKALRDVNLNVTKGEIFGFLGPNGAGKTTTIKLMLGILPLQKGGLSVFGTPPYKTCTRASIGYMPERADYYAYLTPRELLHLYGDIFRINRKLLSERTEGLLAMVGLSAEADRLIGTFSKGMKQKISFAQALINDPDLLILDEPTTGLDPVSRKNMRNVITSLKAEGKTIFFSSHELSEVELISDSIAILDKGHIIACGPLSGFLSAKAEKQTLENYFLQIIEEGK